MRFKLFLAMAMSSFLLSCGDEGNGSNGPSIESSLGGSSEEISSEANSSEGGSQPGNSFDGTSQSGTSETASSEQGGVSSADQSSSSSGKELDSTAFDSIPIVMVRNKTISGVSQKGPFAWGSYVFVFELDGMTLAQTNRSFSYRIYDDDNKGTFTFSQVSLASQYALLKASGYYWNENTGKRSFFGGTLNALVDLSGRDGDSANVNVNLMTHLEYERALYLTTTGMNVPAAKRQAQREVFRAFGVTGDFVGSEKFNIFSNGEGDAALLAISVLMLGDLSEMEFSERLANFVDDIRQDGTWDDAATKAQMAAWACTANLAAIRTVVEGWNAGNEAPAFERIVNAFWQNEYGFGACTAANAGEIKHFAVSDVYYICETGDWRMATVQEYDTYGWNAEADGSVRKGLVTDAFYKYDSLQGRWIAANARDTSLGLNGCTGKRENELGHGEDDKYYACHGGEWQTATVMESDLYGWDAGHDGEIRKGNFSPNAFYKYDSLLNQWLAADLLDTVLKLNGCTQKRSLETGFGSDGAYYICKNGVWQTTPLAECERNAELVAGEGPDSVLYVCDADTFRIATTSEKEVGRGCTSYNLDEDKLVIGHMVCSTSGTWLAAVAPTVSGTFVDSRDGKTYRTIAIGTQMWMAQNLNYEYKVNDSVYGNMCSFVSADSCVKYGRHYTWGAAMDTAKTGCGYGNLTDECINNDRIQGICPEGWHLPSHEEWNTLADAVGGAEIAGKKLKAAEGWCYSNSCGNGEDAYGFTAYASSYIDPGDVTPAATPNYDGISHRYAIFWTSTPYLGLFASNQAYSQLMYYTSDEFYYSTGSKTQGHTTATGYSVRCVKD